MLRKMSVIFELCVLASLPARAQEQGKVELFGGFSYTRFHSSPSINLDGWEISAQHKFMDWLGGVADFAGQYGSGASTYTYLFGPQVSLPARVSPFGHLLVGAAHLGAGGFGNSSFSTAIGGGIDAGITDRISWRAVQVDYLMTQFGGGSQNNFRLSTGILVRF